MGEQMSADGSPEDEDPPAYRLSHLMDELADAFSERGMVQVVAPFGKGGVAPRVTNRVQFQVGDSNDGEERRQWVQDTEDVLDSEGYAWTTAGSRTYVVLGRSIRDLRELRKDDRIHVNKRRGPFKVYRVMEQPSGPEVLQRSDSSITAEVVNVDTGTDGMVVQWSGDDHPWAYVRTKDSSAKGGFRYRKVEPVEWMGRMGPERWFAPSVDAKEDVERDIPAYLETVRDHALAESRAVHPLDADRVEHLFQKPVADVFTTEDAGRVRAMFQDLSEWYERRAGGLEIETDEDRERARENQSHAERCTELADAFNVLHMDAVDDVEHICPDCGKAYLNRFKYPTHRRECDAAEQADEQTDGGEN